MNDRFFSPAAVAVLLLAAVLLCHGCAKEAVAPAARPRLQLADHLSVYHCDSGARIVICPTNDALLLSWQDHSYRLRQAISASGARYQGEGLEWWSKGNEAWLSRLTAQGPDEPLEHCRLDGGR
ncbi:MliC family protein [Desulfuromonas thiophila]|uniref:MliC family protein n=1 Tax=Desulfuromonas thiophila TaxID=57664 RepID=UPI0024A93CF7|nr:MliC family protein [Desulfuromonas thiophila]